MNYTDLPNDLQCCIIACLPDSQTLVNFKLTNRNNNVNVNLYLTDQYCEYITILYKYIETIQSNDLETNEDQNFINKLKELKFNPTEVLLEFIECILSTVALVQYQQNASPLDSHFVAVTFDNFESIKKKYKTILDTILNYNINHKVIDTTKVINIIINFEDNPDFYSLFEESTINFDIRGWLIDYFKNYINDLPDNIKQEWNYIDNFADWKNIIPDYWNDDDNEEKELINYIRNEDKEKLIQNKDKLKLFALQQLSFCSKYLSKIYYLTIYNSNEVEILMQQI